MIQEAAIAQGHVIRSDRLKKYQPVCHTVSSTISLIACIAGIVFAIFWQYKYLTIPFGCGVLSSIYTLYHSFQYKVLQSLQDTNVVLRNSLKSTNEANLTLKNNNTELQNQINLFSEEKNKFIVFIQEFLSKMSKLHMDALFDNKILEDHLNRLEQTMKLFASNEIKEENQLSNLNEMFHTAQSILETFNFEKQYALCESLFKNLEWLRSEIKKDEAYTTKMKIEIQRLDETRQGLENALVVFARNVQLMNQNTEDSRLIIEKLIRQFHELFKPFTSSIPNL